MSLRRSPSRSPTGTVVVGIKARLGRVIGCVQRRRGRDQRAIGAEPSHGVQNSDAGSGRMPLGQERRLTLPRDLALERGSDEPPQGPRDRPRSLPLRPRIRRPLSEIFQSANDQQDLHIGNPLGPGDHRPRSKFAPGHATGDGRRGPSDGPDVPRHRSTLRPSFY